MGNLGSWFFTEEDLELELEGIRWRIFKITQLVKLAELASVTWGFAKSHASQASFSEVMGRITLGKVGAQETSWSRRHLFCSAEHWIGNEVLPLAH